MELGVLFADTGPVMDWLRDRARGNYDKAVSGSILDRAKIAISQLLDIPEESIAFNYSQRAGCSMCPCSPGYYISTTEVTPLTNELHERAMKKDGVYDALVIWTTGGEITTVKVKGQKVKIALDRPPILGLSNHGHN